MLKYAPSAVAFDRRLKLAIGAVTAVAWLALVAFRGYDAWGQREATLQGGERRAANLALIVSTQLRAAFAGADATLRQLTLYSRQVGGPGAPAEQWQPMLQLSRTQRNAIGSLSVIDADGIIRHSSVPAIIGTSRADAHLYRRLSESDRDMMRADTPFRSTTNPQLMLIPLGRRLTTPDGAFEGIVAASFTPIHLREFFQQLELGHDGRLVVYHPSGSVIFDVPAAKDRIGDKADGEPLFERMREQPRAGVVRLPANASSPAAIAAFQIVGEPRLFVAVTLGEREILAEWRHEVTVSAIVLFIVGAGLLVFVRLVFRQLDARAAAEEALQRGQRLDALGHLTGGVAHDFNNLLTVIMMNISVLKLPGSAGAPGSRDAEQIEQIENAAKRAAAITQQLLTFARKQPLQAALADLNDLVRELKPILTRLVGEDIAIELALATEPCLAEIDRVQLETALINLCVNARDAMPQGGAITIRSELIEILDAVPTDDGAVKPGRYVRVAVTDNGTGIAPEHLPRIFDPFFTTKPVGKGTGLGLSMVYGFVKQSGGHVKVESEPDHGTTIGLFFPRATGTLAPKPAPPLLVEATRADEVILLVEDEPVVRQVAEMMLRKLGYCAVSATNGPEAIERARLLPKIDLLLCDIVLPGGMNGRQVAEHLARERPGLRVLFASGYSQDVLQDRGQFTPELRVIPKPYDIHTIAQAVREAIDGEASILRPAESCIAGLEDVEKDGARYP